MFVVPRKKHRKATVRNRLRRLMKEAYRLHKPTFYAALPPVGVVWLAIIYVHTTIDTYTQVEAAMANGLKQLAHRLTPP